MYFKKRDGKEYFVPDEKWKEIDFNIPETFLWLLEELDYVWIPKEYYIIKNREYKQNSNPLKKYLAKMQLASFRSFGYKDSELFVMEDLPAKIIYYYFLNEKENKTNTIYTPKTIIYIKQGNKEYLTTPMIGRRCNKIYIDSQLATNEYKDWINICLKPMCATRYGEIIFI